MSSSGAKVQEGIVAVEMLHPAPHGWWEKAHDVVGIFVGLAIVIATIPFLEELGSWFYVVIVAIIAVQLALALLVAPLRRKREVKGASLNAAFGLGPGLCPQAILHRPPLINAGGFSGTPR